MGRVGRGGVSHLNHSLGFCHQGCTIKSHAPCNTVLPLNFSLREPD